MRETERSPGSYRYAREAFAFVIMIMNLNAVVARGAVSAIGDNTTRWTVRYGVAS